MDQSTTEQQRVTPVVLDLVNGYPETYEGNESSFVHMGPRTRMGRLANIIYEVVSNRASFDPNFPEVEFRLPRSVVFSWGEETVPFDLKHVERKIVELYWQMAARKTNAGLLKVIGDREPIFSQSASYALDLIAPVLRMRGINSVRLINPSLDIFTYLLQKKNGLSVEPIDESELGYTGAATGKSDYRSILSGNDTALVLISPNNPTGAYIAEKELRELAGFCKERKIPLVMDSVFRAYHSKPYDDIAVLEKSGCTYAVIGDTGKAVPTLLVKAGFIICSKDWHQEIASMADIFGQVPLTRLVILREFIRDHAKSGGLGGMLQQIEWNRKILNGAVLGAGKEGLTLAPAVTHVPFGWITLPKGTSSGEVVQHLLEKHHVAVADGAHFFHAESEVSGLRVSLARPGAQFSTASYRLFEGLCDI